jgi:hypothetical protein
VFDNNQIKECVYEAEDFFQTGDAFDVGKYIVWVCRGVSACENEP